MENEEESGRRAREGEREEERMGEERRKSEITSTWSGIVRYSSASFDSVDVGSKRREKSECEERETDRKREVRGRMESRDRGTDLACMVHLVDIEEL